MKKNIFLGCFQDLLDQYYDLVRRVVPDILVTGNYEQVKAMVRDGEVARLGIFFGTTLGTGRDHAEDLHKIDPNLAILIWGGNEFSGGRQVMPLYKNELYLLGRHLEMEDWGRITQKFFSGTLRLEEVPEGACLGLTF